MTAAAKQVSVVPNGVTAPSGAVATNLTSVPDPAAPGESEETRSPNDTGSTATSVAENPSPITFDSKDLSRLSEPPARKKPRLSNEQRIARMAGAISTILDCLDDDPDREGLRKTPQRYAKALLSLTEGYSQSPRDVVGDAQFDENHSEMVLVRDIHLFSLCEHHILPFHGFCHIAYIPSGTVVGLSKLARIVNLYSRRLQVQERLTTQVADAIQEATDARGVMVYLSCTHMCMSMRGVHKTGAKTITTATRGKYATDASLRQEFLGVLKSAAS